VLTTASQESNVKLVEVARRVVDTGTSPVVDRVQPVPRRIGQHSDPARHAAESCRTGRPARMGACVPW
jgi:hypothetical protein